MCPINREKQRGDVKRAGASARTSEHDGSVFVLLPKFHLFSSDLSLSLIELLQVTMINEKMTISPIETTRSELIDYIEYPCFMNWRRLARKPAANGGICGKCPFRNYLEQFVIDNPTASPKFIKFLKEVSAQPELYQRITKLPGYKKQ